MKEFLRIAIVSPVFPPYRGGIGTVAARDAEHLRMLGHHGEVFTPAYRAQTVHEANVTRFQPFFAWGNGAVLLRLLVALREFDVVHLHYPFFGSDILTAFACKMWRIPLVVTYHMKPKASGVLGATFAVYRAVLEPLIFRAASALLVSSEDYANDQHVFHRRRVVHAFSVDVQRFTPNIDRVLARNAFGIDQNIPVILFVGGLDAAHYFKGLSVLLRACASMKTDGRVLIVGDGNRRKDYENMAAELGITTRVHFAGAVSFADLPLAYRAADVHVLPSVDRSEAFGIVTQEAMASGIPSIVSDLPGMRTLVIPNETGERVAPNNPEALGRALDRWCSDRALRERAGARARERAEREFSPENIVTQLVGVYRAVIEDHNR